MPQFCNHSFKKGLFEKCPTKHGDEQMTVLTLILLEIFFSLISVATTKIAPVMSALALFYSMASFYTYMGMPTNKFIDVSQSYFAVFKLSAFLIGYLFDESLPIDYRFEFSYFMMTLILTIDAYYGFYNLVKETRLKKAD